MYDLVVYQKRLLIFSMLEQIDILHYILSRYTYLYFSDIKNDIKVKYVSNVKYLKISHKTHNYLSIKI